MANNFSLITKYVSNFVDTVFASESKTAVLERNMGTGLIDNTFKEAGYIKIMSILMDGLSDYYRENNGLLMGDDRASHPTKTGYKVGNVETEWEIFKLQYDRGIQFRVDEMDNEEQAGMVIANLLKEFLRTKVVPEVDAVRLSRLAGKTSLTLGNRVSGAIADNTILKEFHNAFEWMTEHEVPTDNQVMFVSPKVMTLIRNSNELVRYLSQEEYKNGDVSFTITKYQGREIIEVPSSRFFTDVKCGENGYHATANSKVINFMIVSLKACTIVKKAELKKVFGPEQVQDFDGYKTNFRLYHDIIIPKNKLAGVYVSVSDVVASTKSNVLYVNVAKEGGSYNVTEFFTTPAGIIADKMFYSTAALKVGETFVSGGTNKQITNGVPFTKIGSETKGYFALVDAHNNILAVSSEITLPVA